MRAGKPYSLLVIGLIEEEVQCRGKREHSSGKMNRRFKYQVAPLAVGENCMIGGEESGQMKGAFLCSGEPFVVVQQKKTDRERRPS